MSDYTEVEYKSPFSRIADSIKGVLVGLIFVVAAPIGLWINEKDAVERQASLGEGARAVVTVPSNQKDTSSGKLIHTTGKAVTTATLADSDFGISQNAIKLIRTVQMYQWVEEKKEKKSDTVGGSEKKVTTYTYNKEWSSSYHDSQKFKIQKDHENPQMTFQSKTLEAEDVKVGEFTLSKSLISKISNATPLAITAEMVQKMPPQLGDKYKAVDGKLQSGDPAKPNVGDLKIGFEVVNQQDVSICASSTNGALSPWKASNNYEIELLQSGTVDAQAMFQKAMSDAAMMTWVFRFLGFIVMWIGVSLIFAPIGTVARSIPLFGMLMGGAVDAGVGLFAFGIAVVASGTVIAIAWFAARPGLSIGIMVAVLALLFVAKSMRGGSAPAKGA